MRGQLHHIELYVSNINRSIKFWGWLLEELGYQPFQNWQYGQSWKLDHTYIVFVQVEERYLDIPYHRCRAGLNDVALDRNSTRLNSSHVAISYAVFCLKQKHK